jgi:hypothetical protein
MCLDGDYAAADMDTNCPKLLATKFVMAATAHG